MLHDAFISGVEADLDLTQVLVDEPDLVVVSNHIFQEGNF
jgi:hypothetical protein